MNGVWKFVLYLTGLAVYVNDSMMDLGQSLFPMLLPFDGAFQSSHAFVNVTTNNSSTFIGFSSAITF